MFKKIWKGFFALVAMAIMSNPANAFYTDMDETHWAYQSIKFLTEVGVVVGYPDGTYKPDIPVTRAEFASMAIKALGQESANVTQEIHFNDLTPDFWAYNIIQKAVYFDLIPDAKGESYRPYDSVTRAEAINIAVNALTTQQISQEKADDIIAKSYQDYEQLPAWFLMAAAKAHVLDLVVVMPGNEGKMEAMRPANRAEVAQILYKMMQEAKLNPNAKLAEVMQKRVAEGFIVDNVKVQGSIGIVPAGTIFPIKLETVVGSEVSNVTDVYTAKTPKNYVTKEKYLLISENSDMKGQVKYVQRGKLFKQQGEVIIKNELLVTPNDQAVMVYGVATLTPDKIGFWRKIFKGKQVITKPGEIVNIRLLAPIKIDLTNGYIYE
ncbi:MAG: S-layer homology domain-containing protein [Cyanobacteria bacterium SIG28]|nr:S-layer homology domain-containing protein [Cyanobacteria bacterium SIG28]